MATRARLSQDRSRQRREQLLDAAIELFAAGGARGITHRAVAAKAGLPPATTTYYFTSIDELIDAALSRHLDAWLRDLEALSAADDLPAAGLGDATALIAAFFAARSPKVVALQLGVFLAAVRNERLRPRVIESLDALESLAAKMFGGLGIADPEPLGEATVAAIAGSAMSRLTERRDEEDEAEALSHSIQGLVTAALLSEAEVAATLDRAELKPVSRPRP